MGAGEIEFIARGLLMRGDAVLLCRNVKHGYSYLPGGHVEFGESAPEALAREFLEEAKLEVTVGRALLASELRFVQKGRERHELTVVFHVEHDTSADVVSAEDGIEFHWVGRAALATANLRPELIRRWLVERAVGDPLAWITADERE